MKAAIVSAISILLLAFSPMAPAQSSMSHVANSAAQKHLVIQLEIPARLPDVWQAFATSDGLSSWLAPNCTVDLRPGGDWLVRFPGGSTGGGTIVSFVPQKEIVIAALAPDQFPHVRADRTKAVFDFEPRGSTTIVRLTQSGWKDGAEWDRAYEYLVAGNAQLLAMLHRRFVDGPTDWAKEMGEIPAKGGEGTKK